MLGIIGVRRRREQQRARWLQSISHWKVMSLSKLWEIWRGGEPRVLAVHGVTKSQTWLSDWTTSSEQRILVVLGRWFREHGNCQGTWDDKWDSGQLERRQLLSVSFFFSLKLYFSQCLLRAFQRRRTPAESCGILRWKPYPPATWMYSLGLSRGSHRL